ncbi:MAG: FAD-binding oxidoreductase [bacterium]
MIPKIIHQLQATLPPECILTGDDVGSRSAGSWGKQDWIEAKALVRPQSTQEVSAVLKICHDAGQTVVTHGGLTGVVQGAKSTENDIVLSLELMNQIEEIDPIGRTATVQAGVILQKLQEAAEQAGLLFPLDLGARGTATLGGNIATNAGGNHVIRYGMAREMVLGLEAVLADGTVISSMNKMLKNNAGYDLKQLFIGSEGTLGVVTRVVLRLRELPKSHSTAFVALESFEKVTHLLKLMDAALAGTLSAFEVMWYDFYELVTTPPAKNRPPLPYDYPYYTIVEAPGSDQDADVTKFQNALERATEIGLIADAVVAQSKNERTAIWEMRDSVTEIFRYDPVFLFDVSLAIRDMQNYVNEVRANLQKTWPQHHCSTFGHLGDGNLHFMISAGNDDAETQLKVEEIVYKPLIKLNGSVSAEHGIGLEKKRYLRWCRSEAEIALMRTLKQALDPKGILNPGRVI